MLNRFICTCAIVLCTLANCVGQCVGCPSSLTAAGSLAPPTANFNGHTSEVHTFDGSTPLCYLPVSNTLNGHLEGIENALCMLRDSIGINYERDSVALSKIDSLIGVIDLLRDSLPNAVGIISSDGSVTVSYTTIGDSTTYDLTLVANGAVNGLYLDGSIIKQGSPLIENTYIDGDGFNYSMKGAKGLSFNGDTIIITTGDSSDVSQGIYFKKNMNAFFFGNNIFSNKSTIDNTVRIGSNINTATLKEGWYIGDRIYSTDGNSSRNIVIADSANIINSTSSVLVFGTNLKVDQRGDSSLTVIGNQNDVRSENYINVILGDDNVVKDGYSLNYSGGLIVGQNNLINSSSGVVLGVGNDFKNLGTGYVVGANNEIKDKVLGIVIGDGNIVTGNGITGNRSAIVLGTNVNVSDPQGYTIINTDNSVAGAVNNTKIATDFDHTLTVNANQYKFYTNTQASIGVKMDKNDLSWSVMSDSAIKKDFKAVSYDKLYNQFKKIPINTWSLKLDTLGKKRYVGIFAQDFYTLMDKGLGIKTQSKKEISQTNMDGVQMALIKQQAILIDDLYKKIAELEKKIKKE